MKVKLDQSMVKQYVKYHPESGIFTWIKESPRGRVGEVAGSKVTDGYITIQINRIPIRAHNLVWLYVYGRLPEVELDHINGIRDDNRISNLREVTRRENSLNRPRHRAGSLGGCYYHQQSRKWMARIYVQGRKIYLGIFPTEQEAHAIYNEALEHLNDLDWFKQIRKKKTKGYYWRQDAQKWQANGWKDNKTVYLGCYDTEEEASQAYRTFLESNK